jgi:hypothetical protein
MAKIVATMPDVGNPSSEPPRREPVPPGDYAVMLVSVKDGFKEGVTPPIATVTLEFQILHQILADASIDDKLKGRRVWQQYVCAEDPNVDSGINALRGYELKQMIAATRTPHEILGQNSISFDSDDIMKNAPTLKITVVNKTKTFDDGVEMDGKKKTKERTFSNVQRIDTAETPDADALV